MTTLKDILTTVGEISNSNSSTGEQINMISEKCGVNHKVSTVLHFASKDGNWNPTALEMLSEISSELDVKEIEYNSTDKKEFDFYMINYLNDPWREQIIVRMRRYDKLSFFNVWMRNVTGMVIQDLKKINKYPTDKTNFTVNRHFPGDGMVYNVVSDWYDNIYDDYIKTKNS